MHGTKCRLIITVNLHFEYALKRDICDYLFLIDRGVNIVETPFRGVYIIECTGDPIEISKALINSPIPKHALTTVVPVIEGLKADRLEAILERVRGLIEGSECKSFIVKCALRGIGISDDLCERRILAFLRGLGLKAFLKGEAECAVIVESINDMFYIYVGPLENIRI